MVNPRQIKLRQDATLEALAKACELLVVNEPYEATDPAMAATLGVPKDRVRDLRVELEQVGGLRTERRVEVVRSGSGVSAHGRAQMRTAWILLVRRDEAERRLRAKYAEDDRVTAERSAAMFASLAERSRGKPRPRKDKPGNGIHTRPASLAELETVHIAGPDPRPPLAALAPERRDEAEALVAAARQYAGIRHAVEAKIAELEALGVTVDRAAVAKAIRLPSEPALAAVADALPYIDRLERHAARLAESNTDLRAKLANMPALLNENQRLKDQVGRMVREKAEGNGHGMAAASPAARA